MPQEHAGVIAGLGPVSKHAGDMMKMKMRMHSGTLQPPSALLPTALHRAVCLYYTQYTFEPRLA